MDRNANRRLVVDAGAAIRMKQLDRLGKELYTTPGVYDEVKERQAKQQFDLGPIEVQVTQPTEGDIKFVRAFAKETGDLGFLSANDISLIALTLRLQKETGNIDHLRKSPIVAKLEKSQCYFAWAPTRNDKAVSSTADPWAPSKDKMDDAVLPEFPEGDFDEESDAEAESPSETKKVETTESNEENINPTTLSEKNSSNGLENDKENLNPDENQDWGECEELVPVKEEDDDDDESSIDGSDCGEWVTAENLHRFDMTVEDDELIEVACVTTDYSVQNVLIQIGLNVVSIDGYKVRSVKLWGLLCRACRHSFRDTTKIFCEKCGHATVDRVPISVDSTTGEMTVHDNRKKINLRGTIYSIPKRRGGRQKPGERDIILAEDELMMGGRDREIRRQQKLAAKEKMMRDPFVGDSSTDQWQYRHSTRAGDILNQFDARAEVGYGRKNPNANNFHRRTGNKKKK